MFRRRIAQDSAGILFVLPRQFRILVIGGYGNFGSRICRALGCSPGIQVIVAGRNLRCSTDFVNTLPRECQAEPCQLDHTAACLSEQLEKLDVNLVIHTSGPFQGQDFHVAEACIKAKVHYVDLADARDFVVNFQKLHDRAVGADLLLVSGASTLPGITSVVVNALTSGLQQILGIRVGIAPAQKNPRGIGTVKSVLSYCGKPFLTLVDGEWKQVFGWQDIQCFDYPEIGKRWGGCCDVPDVELMPQIYPELKTVQFHAALGSAVVQWGLWILAYLVRLRIIRDPVRMAPLLKRWSDKLNVFGDETSAMFVQINGRKHGGDTVVRTWRMIAHRNHGPEIPCIPAIILGRKLARGELSRRGAIACLNLFSTDDFQYAVSDFAISTSVSEGTI